MEDMIKHKGDDSGDLNQLNSLRHRETTLPLVVQIRLGTLSSDGRGYPVDLDYFNFSVAEGVTDEHRRLIAEYGEKPKQIPIRFISTELKHMIPSSYRLYKGGFAKKGGGRQQGSLYCIGNGPHPDGTPGIAEVRGEKDPITRIFPKRPCLGDKCPDYLNHKGQQQCNPGMRIMFMIDGVAGGLAFINTQSVNTMNQITNMINWGLNTKLLRNNWDQLPWILYRKEKASKYWDEKNQKERTGTVNPVYLKFDEEKFRWMVDQGLISRDPNNLIIGGKKEDQILLEGLKEAQTEVFHGEIQNTTEDTGPDYARDLLDDSEVQSLFSELEKVTGKEYTIKARLLSMRSKGSGLDLREKVVAALRVAVDKFKTVEVEPAPTPEPAPNPSVTPAKDDGPVPGGIL